MFLAIFHRLTKKITVENSRQPIERKPGADNENN
jgi:hypothetical protein